MRNSVVVAPLRRLAGGVAILLGTALISSPLRAEMLLTSEGAALGLRLTTFATGFVPYGVVGPLGAAFLPGGGVLVTDFAGDIRLFPSDSDGQNAASVPVVQSYGSSNAIGVAQLGDKIYMTQQRNGALVQINPNGTLNQVIVTGIPVATAVVANQKTGHLFVSTAYTNTIWDVDPVAKTKTPFVTADVDGLTLSGDGTTLYGEAGDHIVGWSVLTGAPVFDSGVIPGGPDGTALGSGALAGQLFVNTHAGQLIKVDRSTLAQTVLASGGSRGDFVMVDTNTNTLLITQADRILRLAGATFETESPEPETFALIACGIAVLTCLRRRLSPRGGSQ